MAQSVASKALDELLNSGSAEAQEIRAHVDRMMLWRYRNDKGKPSAETAAKLEQLSNGLVPANGWRDVDEDGDAA
jgi:hypothetical protein